MKVKKVVVPIAGLGTRLLPATKAIPKEMLPLVNKPIIQYIVEEISKAGFEELIFITHSSKYSVENHFDTSFELESTLKNRVKRSLLNELKAISSLSINISSIRQGEAKGLGHAINCAKNIINNEPFAVVLPDMLLREKKLGFNLALMKKAFEKNNRTSILVAETSKKELSNYGVVEVKKNNLQKELFEVLKIVEKPSAKKIKSNLFAVGRYIFNNSIFSYISKVKPDKTGEIQLTDAIKLHLKEKDSVDAFKLDGTFHDCGDKIGYLKAIVEYALFDKSIGKDFKTFLKKYEK